MASQICFLSWSYTNKFAIKTCLFIENGTELVMTKINYDISMGGKMF